MEQETDIPILERHFNTFYVHYPSTKCTSYPDKLVYKVNGLMAKQATQEANDLIKRLNLPLVAKVNSKHGIFMDSFVVTPIDNETK